MLSMSEKELTNIQRQKIKEIKAMWIKELDEIEEVKAETVFDDRVNEPYRKLEKKYKSMISEVLAL